MEAIKVVAAFAAWIVAVYCVLVSAATALHYCMLDKTIRLVLVGSLLFILKWELLFGSCAIVFLVYR